jgi:hypothetical protein
MSDPDLDELGVDPELQQALLRALAAIEGTPEMFDDWNGIGEVDEGLT